MNKKGDIIVGSVEPKKEIGSIWIDTNEEPNGGSVKHIKDGEWSSISSSSSNSNPQVIDMLPGEYLSDVLARITDASEAKPYTINFYNHSKTIDWSKWTELIQWPRFVYLNFVNIVWWPNDYHAEKIFYEGLSGNNPTDKLMLGFKFDRTNNSNHKQSSGLPNSLNFIYFGGLDEAYSEANDYDTLIGDLDNYGNGSIGLVYCKGNKEDNENNAELYKKINGSLHKITGNFKSCNLAGLNLIGSYLYGCVLQNANLQYANLANASLKYADLQNANLQYANLANAILQNANLTNARLQYANLENTYLQNAVLISSSLLIANLKYANLANANLQYANLEGSYLQNTNFSYANLANSYLRNANLENSFLINVDIQHADLGGSYLQNANLTNSNLEYANIQGANLTNANLQDANFTNASLASSNLQYAYLANANLGNTNLECVNLRNADLENIQVNSSSVFLTANLTGAKNLPTNLNTKAKFIAVVGVDNVNAETIWIDGTSILS